MESAILPPNLQATRASPFLPLRLDQPHAPRGCGQNLSSLAPAAIGDNLRFCVVENRAPASSAPSIVRPNLGPETFDRRRPMVRQLGSLLARALLRARSLAKSPKRRRSENHYGS